jgi:hypothetical protein
MGANITTLQSKLTFKLNDYVNIHTPPLVRKLQLAEEA